ncbi:E3 ubiquitin-protein ligase MARCHF2-like isoform X2 [Leptopilina boulardi]|uniref:E3 ubiquitin-protein ligase MARCHF2-like isoform X2 n=1 Tax=Leptopilina boulardi TaxID=63433 RepID=UPI0021F5F31C|nr:E3 ubiquitin-protein ligase MARCHF2-like isoform X2 [Leptopilina boulardi]
MSTSREISSENENQSSDVATNRDYEDSPLDSKIEINKPEEENKRKLTSMLKEYEWDKKDESQEKEAHCQKDVESENSSNNVGDICRICHMGNFPPLRVNRTLWERRTHRNRQIDIQASSGSNFAYLGPLISACKCRGTVGLVHVECLERWLTESGHIRCELCGHKFSTKRVPRHSIYQSIVIWFKTVFATRQMMVDILYLAATTPLALFSIYVCALALKLLVKRGIYEVPWMVIAMLPTCSLTLVAYWGWLITLGRFHSRRWQTFWRHNFIVRLIPENVNELTRGVTRDDLPDNAEEMELDQWQEEDVNIFLNVN